MPAGGLNYEYILVRVDNLIMDSCKEEQLMQSIIKTYPLNKFHRVYTLDHKSIGTENQKTIPTLSDTLFMAIIM